MVYSYTTTVTTLLKSLPSKDARNVAVPADNPVTTNFLFPVPDGGSAVPCSRS